MKEKTVIIAHRRKGSDYWEGYDERSESETQEWVDYFRSINRIIKVFSSMAEYSKDCNKLLDKLERKRKSAGQKKT